MILRGSHSDATISLDNGGGGDDDTMMIVMNTVKSMLGIPQSLSPCTQLGPNTLGIRRVHVQ